MQSIFLKDFRQFFSGLSGYLSVGLFQLLMGLFLFIFPETSIFDYGYATLDKFFELAPWILIMLVPAITMRSLSDEFRSGTWEILRTRPFSLSQIVKGKFWAAFFVGVLSLLPSFLYLYTIHHLSLEKSIDTGGVAGAYVGLFLLLAMFTWIGIFCSSLTQNPIIAYLVAAFGCFLLFFGFQSLAAIPAFQGHADYWIQQLGAASHYRGMSRGLIEWPTLVYFIGMAYIFLFATQKILEKKIMHRLFHSKYGLWAIGMLVAGVYWLSGMLPGRIDLTEDKRYTVSEPAKKILQGLQQPISITVLLKGASMPSAFRKLQSSTDGLLRIFQSYSNGKLTYQFVTPETFLEDPNIAPNLNDTLKAEWLKANAIKQNEVTRTGTKASFVYPLAIVEAGDYSTTLNLLQGQGQKGFLNPDADVFQREIITRSEAQMEYLFVSAIQDLTRERLPKIAYLVGQGQPTGAETYDLSRTLQSKYDFYLLDLERQPYISDSIDAVLIVKPSLSFSEAAKLKLDQYLMRGGNVLFLLDALNADMDSLLRNGTEFTAYARNLNLEDLLFRYGARINANLVQDMQSDMLPQTVGSIGGQPQIELLPWPYFPLLYGSDNHPISKNLDAVVMQFPNSVDTVGAEGIRKHILLASSNTSRLVGTPVMVTVEILKQLENPSAFQDKNIPVAILLEGPFKSLYARRMAGELEEIQKKMGIPYLPQAKKNGKILITGDGDWVLGGASKQGPLPMGANPFTQYNFANRDFLVNTIDYMTDPSGIMATRNRDFTLRLLDPKKLEKQANTWRWINMGLPLFALALTGLIVSVYRRKRYER